jgi:hypothetical protein
MTSQRRIKLAIAGLILAGLPLAAVSAAPQKAPAQKPLPAADAPTTPHRTRLILKDGSYQLVMSYRVTGNVVRYISAERAGAEEEIPLSLVDLDATRKWEAQRVAETNPDAQSGQPPPIDPELLKEEAERASLTPEVAPVLHLPEDNSVLALDTFHGTPELVPLPQSEGDLNRSTAHSVVRGPINPASSAHMITQIKGEASYSQLHVNDPVIYLRIGDATAPPTGGTPITVDTHGANNQAPLTSAGGVATSRYVIVHADVRVGARVIDSFKISLLGSGRTQPDVTETKTELLPDGHWMKITPRESLGFGEYALMEVLTDRDVNLGVWDFGVHPVAPENKDALKPQSKRPYSLEHRRPN